jgi:hypothetical protein
MSLLFPLPPTHSQWFFWSCIGACLFSIILLASLALWMVKKNRTKTDFKLIAQHFKLNFYDQINPYSAGVYKGRGVLLQRGQKTQNPPVAVFCDNPLQKTLRLPLKKRAQKLQLQRWTQPSFLRPCSLELFFEPHRQMECFKDSPLSEAASKLWDTPLQGTLELKGRTIAYLEAHNENLQSLNEYEAALNLCLGLAEALESNPIPLQEFMK